MIEKEFLALLCIILILINCIYFVVSGNWYFWGFCVFFLIGFNIAIILGDKK